MQRHADTGDRTGVERPEEHHGSAWLAFVDVLPAAALAISASGRVIRWNTHAEQLWGWPASQALGTDLRAVVPASERDVVERLCAGETARSQITLCHGDAPERAHPVVGIPLAGTVVLFGVDRSSAEPDDARFRSLVQRASDLLIVSDADGAIRYVSPAADRILGRSPVDLVGRTPLDLVHLDDVERLAAAFAEQAGLPGDGDPVELRVEHADGTWRWLEATTTNLLDDETVAGMVINAHDITERKRLENQLTHLALHDPLTGLPNRALLTDRLALAIERLRRHASTLTVLLLDLDRFKSINDALGHEVGDRLLMAVAERLTRVVRPEDTVARLGGDEFVIVCQEVSEGDSAIRIAERVGDAFAEPFPIGRHRIQVTPSIGMTTTSCHDVSPEQVLRDADVAMYRAKRAGRARFEPFDAGMRNRVAERLRAEAALQRAVDRHEFVVHYQPVIDVEAGRVQSVEALVRWRRPPEELVLPGSFLELAEYTNLILPIGRWVLHRACDDQARLSRALASPPPVSVNLSPAQLVDPSLPDDVAAALRSTGVAPDRLLLEVSAEGLDRPETRSAITELNARGVRVAVDDFGSGDLGLRALRELPVDVVKTHRSVVAALPGHPADAALVGAVVSVAAALDITVVAKGVERPDQLAALRELGCPVAQGFHVAQPVPPDDLVELLR